MIVKKYPINPNIEKTARLLAIAGDTTRIRILCLMFEQKKACVSEIAESIDTSMQNASQHLRIMKDAGLFITTREGNMICYELITDDFTEKLKKIVYG